MYFSRCRQHLSTKIVCREKLHFDKAFKNVTYVNEDGAQYKIELRYSHWTHIHVHCLYLHLFIAAFGTLRYHVIHHTVVYI